MKFLKKLFKKKTNLESDSKANKKQDNEYNRKNQRIEAPQKIDIGDKYIIHELSSNVPQPSKETTIFCKSFLSEGMKNVGQQEVVLTIAIPENGMDSNYIDLNSISRLFNTIYEYAKKGQTVSEGQFTAFPKGKNFLGFQGIVYSTNPERLNEKIPGNCLSLVLLKERELNIAMSMGYMRVLTMLGKERLQYPFPIWNELNRQDIALLDEMSSQTILSQPIPRINESKINVYQDKERILNITLPKEFNQHKETSVPAVFDIGYLTILPGFNLQIKFCKTWSSNPEFMDVLSGGNEDNINESFGILGCFLMIVGNQEKNAIRPVEDGYGVFMTDVAWKNFFDAYRLKQNFSLKIEEINQEDIIGLEMIWKN